MDTERIDRVKTAMADEGLDALVCRLPENVVMLSGHWPLLGFSFLLLPLDGEPLLIVPHCDEVEAREEAWNADIAVFKFGVLTAGDPYQDIAGILKSRASGKGWTRIGFEVGFETVAPPWNAAEPAIPAAATRALLESVFGADRLVDATGLLMQQRARKTPEELENLRRVNEIAALGLEAFTQMVDVGISGVELVAGVEHAIVTKGTGHKGARRVRAFAQVSTGAETLTAFRPMLISTTRPLAAGEQALLELAVVADGFWADRTRVRVAGNPTPEKQAAFDVVLAAQQAAIAAVGVGVRAEEVDRAARDIIHAAGFSDEEFLHVTGHGLGFRYHEPTPVIMPGSPHVLEEGMTCTVEPGIYRADFGGLRIEENVIVTGAGAEVMGVHTAELA